MRSAARFFLSSFLFAASVASAADMNLEARLVWGTNDEKGGPNCKPVDPELSASLHRTFKWSHYFEITKQVAAIPEKQTRDIKMSERCTLRVKNLGGSRVEVRYIGEGKEVLKGAYTLLASEWKLVGGNSKGDTAWFVGLRSGSASNKAISKN
jgi:hypothetical protein